jgi:glycosyltransferase involved in cell wall biosynthesis
MRILHLTTFLQGGAGLVIATLAASQARDGHDVTVVASRTGAPGYGNYPGHLEGLVRAGVAVHLVDSMFRRDPVSNDAVVRFVKAEASCSRPFDIVHAHAAVPAAIGMRLGQTWPGLRLLQTMHGWGSSKSKEQERADVEVLARLERIVVPNRTSAELMRRFGLDAERLRVIPYGVADDMEVETGHDPDLQQIRFMQQRGRSVVCCVGTINDRKNQRLLLEAMALVPQRLRPVCVFVGEGETENLRRLARGLNVASSVRWLGYKPQARALLACSDWLALPSQAEGMPLTVLEAFADRVPVLASDIPEIRELIDHGRNGLLFASNDSRALAARLETAVTMPTDARRAMCDSARGLYVDCYQRDTMARAYAHEYAVLLAGPGQPSTTPCAA